ncbi:hypothetical protein AB7M49_004818 [Bradyrhizobium elkanii]
MYSLIYDGTCRRKGAALQNGPVTASLVRSVAANDAAVALCHHAVRRVSGITSQITNSPNAAIPARPMKAVLLPSLSLT